MTQPAQVCFDGQPYFIAQREMKTQSRRERRGEHCRISLRPLFLCVSKCCTRIETTPNTPVQSGKL